MLKLKGELKYTHQLYFMKRLQYLIALIGLVGCAHMSSNTELTFDTKGNTIESKTHVGVTTVFDGQASLTKVLNHTQGTNGAGTYVSGVNESSTSSNIVNIINAAASAAAKASVP